MREDLSHSHRTMSKEQATYTHGHHASVVSNHALRTARDSAAFLLPHIKPTHQILDLGCGPGTITIDLARLVPQGHVTGGDAVESVLDQARALASSLAVPNLTFTRLDANALPFPPGTFDVVYAHQLLQHVADPVAVLREMRRVAKSPSGIVAARDADYRTFAWHPQPPGLDAWNTLYRRVARANGGEPDAGRHLGAWAREAGFLADEIAFSWDAWCYQGERAGQFAESWAGRTLASGFAETAGAHGLATEEELREISRAWSDWATQEGRFIAIPNGEILCRRAA